MRAHRIRLGLWSSLTAMAVFFAPTDTVDAQETKRGPEVGVAGQGTDMWTQAMSGLRLFTPHRNDCNVTTEVFVKIYTENTVDFGFCIDKDEHSAGAVEWEDARQECLDDGKRLPEPAEFKVACQIGTGLSNTTDDYEWVSNHSTYGFSITTYYHSSAAAGSGSCKNFTGGHIGTTTSVSNTLAFRCVR